MNTHPLDVALAYARRGWPVFPLSPNTKIPFKGSNGFYDASTSPERVRQWWTEQPDANIGIATGQVSGLSVLDVDVKNGAKGRESLTELEGMAQTLTVHTPSGGCHFYYGYPEGGLPSKNGLLPGIDLKADGGYVVGPGSTIGGKNYEWEDPEAHTAALPESILALMRNGNGAKPLAAPLSDGPIPDHDRNTTLTSLAGTMRRRGMTAEAIEAALQAENSKRCSPPLSESEVRGIAASVSRYAPSAKSDAENMTDAGNARRLVNEHGHDLRYCHAWGKWLVWDGKRWKRDDAGAVVEKAKKTVRAIYAEAAAEPDKEQREALGKWARESERRHRIMDMIALAQSEPGIPVAPLDLDADTFLFNCRKGTVDLRTGNLRPHQREDNITKIAPVDYDPAAKLELWDSFLHTVTDGDSGMMDFLQRAAGYSLTGDTGEEKLFMPHGPGATGKSTFLEAFKSALGEYAATADFEAFLKRSNVGGPRNDIARLAGARLVVSIEVDEGKQLAEGLVKMLTGGDTVAARFLHKEAFEFAPQFKLWLAANHEPKVSDEDTAMWRRILRIPFEHVIPEDQRDPAVKKKLKSPEARAAILSWAVQGCLAWLRDGLKVPEKVRAATAEYRKDMDPLQEWFDAHCVLQADAWTASEALKKSYLGWAKENKTDAVKGRGFGQRLKERGLRDEKKEGKRGWRGVSLPGTGEPWTEKTDSDQKR